MNTETIRKWKSAFTRRLLAPLLALSLVGSFAAYEIVKPATAIAASAAPAASALSEDSVSALLALDRAMETVASHVTPAVVNVTVTARNKERQISGMDQLPEEFRHFFGGQLPRNSEPRLNTVWAAAS